MARTTASSGRRRARRSCSSSRPSTVRRGGLFPLRNNSRKQALALSFGTRSVVLGLGRRRRPRRARRGTRLGADGAYSISLLSCRSRSRSRLPARSPTSRWTRSLCGTTGRSPTCDCPFSHSPSLVGLHRREEEDGGGIYSHASHPFTPPIATSRSCRSPSPRPVVVPACTVDGAFLRRGEASEYTTFSFRSCCVSSGRASKPGVSRRRAAIVSNK